MAYNLQLVTKANTTDVILDPTPNILKVSVVNVKGIFFQFLWIKRVITAI